MGLPLQACFFIPIFGKHAGFRFVHMYGFLMAASIHTQAAMYFAAAFLASVDGSGFFSDAVDGLKAVVVLIGAGMAGWGVVNLLEGYGNDNPGAKSQGVKQLMAGAGIIIVGLTVIPQLNSMITSWG